MAIIKTEDLAAGSLSVIIDLLGIRSILWVLQLA